MPGIDMEARLDLAEAFLREAVFRSRARQAAGVALKQAERPAAGTCGLGQRAAIELELDTRGRELFGELWPEPPGEAELERIRAVMANWIERQDALDRERNHFLKAFRARHGFDRTQYAPDLLAVFDAGLLEVNQKEQRERRHAAQALLGPSGTTPFADQGPPSRQ